MYAVEPIDRDSAREPQVTCDGRVMGKTRNRRALGFWGSDRKRAKDLELLLFIGQDQEVFLFPRQHETPGLQIALAHWGSYPQPTPGGVTHCYALARQTVVLLISGVWRPGAGEVGEKTHRRPAAPQSDVCC